MAHDRPRPRSAVGLKWRPPLPLLTNTIPRAPFRERDRGLKSSAPHRWWPDKVLSPPRKIRHDGPAWDVAGRESSTFDLSARAVARPSAPFARSSLIVYSTRKSQLNLASKRLRLSMRPQSDKSTLVAHVVSALISTTGVGALSVGPAQFPFHLLGRDTDESDAHPDSNRLLPAQSWPTGDAVREGDGPGELELLPRSTGDLQVSLDSSSSSSQLLYLISFAQTVIDCTGAIRVSQRPCRAS